MITVYGRESSVNVQSVMWCITELGLAHDRHDVGGPFGGTDQPAFQAKNPMGLVPVIEDGNLTLWESTAILRYLMRRYGDHPLDPAQAAEIEKWADWSRSHIYPHLNTVVFVQLVRYAPNERDEAAIAKSVAQLDPLMDVAGHALREKALGQERLTLADFAFGVLLHRYFNLEIERNPTKEVHDYYQALCQRPAYKSVVMRDIYETRNIGAKA